MSKLPDSLTKAITAFENAKSYQVYLTVKYIKMMVGDVHTTVTTETFVAPDRLKAASLEEINGQTNYYIAIGSKSYSSLDGTTWTKTAPNSTDFPQNNAAAFGPASIIVPFLSSIKSPAVLANYPFKELPDETNNDKQIGLITFEDPSEQKDKLKWTLKYDKKANLLIQFDLEITNSLGDPEFIIVKISNYNDPKNKVEAPI